MIVKDYNSKKGILRIYYKENKRSKRELLYDIDENKKLILMYPEVKGYYLKEIRIEGFDELPKEFKSGGYISGGGLYYLSTRLEKKGIEKLTIIDVCQNQIRKSKSRLRAIMSYRDFKEYIRGMKRINSGATNEKVAHTNEFFSQTYPKYYIKTKSSSKRLFRKLIDGLDYSTIQHIKKDDIERLGQFYSEVLRIKGNVKIKGDKLLAATKRKIDTVAVEQIIDEFEAKLKEKGVSESDWGKFLRKNMFIINSRYIKCITEINVILGSARKMDFGLIDTQGFLDIFEIKKPETKLLSKTKDRGNYYLHSETVKAIAQAEKYLFHAESKRAILKEDLERSRKVKSEIIRPKALLLIGSGKQLDSKEKRDDFRLLRESYKNIQIILYDELLSQLKNQISKSYTEAK